MATGTSIITRAVRMLTGASGYTLTANQQTDFMGVFNSLLDSLQIERMMIYQILQESKVLTPGTGSYTMGTAGTFGTTRPVKIEKAFFKTTGGIDLPMKVIPYDQYDNLVLKTLNSDYPQYLFNDCSIASGAATIRLWPVPQTAITLYIDSWKQFTALAAIGDTVTLPPGYQRFLEYRMCFELAPEFGKKITPEIALGMKESRAAIKTMNEPSLVMNLPAGIAGGTRYNIYADS